MATMIPHDIEEFETEGEKALYRFLEAFAKPDAHYLCFSVDSSKLFRSNRFELEELREICEK